MNALTENDIKAIADLRARDFAVCVFLPDEMGNANPARVEDLMCEAGWNAIHWSQTDPELSND